MSAADVGFPPSLVCPVFLHVRMSVSIQNLHIVFQLLQPKWDSCVLKRFPVVTFPLWQEFLLQRLLLWYVLLLNKHLYGLHRLSDPERYSKRLCCHLPPIFPSTGQISRAIACENISYPDNDFSHSWADPFLYQRCTRQVRADCSSFAKRTL